MTQKNLQGARKGDSVAAAKKQADHGDDHKSARILIKAALRAKDYFKLTNKQFAEIIGISEASMSRLQGKGRTALKPKEKELILLFLRVFRSLDALMGGHEGNEHAWLTSHNRILNSVPLVLMKKIDGLNRVVDYLDAARGHG